MNEGIDLASIIKDQGIKLGSLLQEKDILVKDLGADMTVKIDLKLVSKRLQSTKDGKKFILLTLADKSGVLRAIDWSFPQEYDKNLRIGQIVRVSGHTVMFENRLQLNIFKEQGSLEVLDETQIYQEKFIEKSSKDPQEMILYIKNAIDTITTLGIKKLLESFFVQDNGFIKKFTELPAGMTVHHAYKNGLLEHTCTVLKISINLCSIYKGIIDEDIMIAGAILHDIGKIYEYSIYPYGIEKTDNGELIGHIVMGCSMIYEKARNIEELDNKTLEHIVHIVASHHGEIEYGSPVIPKTIEAQLLHFCDNMDSKVSQFRTCIDNSLKSSVDSNWTEYDKSLGRRLMFNKEFFAGGSI